MTKTIIASLILLVVTVSVIARPGSEESKTCNSCNELVSFLERISASDVHVVEGLVDWCQNSGYVQRNDEEWAERTGNSTGKSITDLHVNLRSAANLTCQELPELCRRVEMCPSGEVGLPLRANDTNCDFCINMMTHVKQIVTSQETENELKSQIQQACGYLGSFRDECTQLVDKNLDDWFDYLRNSLNPKVVCQRTGFCLQSSENPRLGEIVGILPAGLDVDQDGEEMIPFTAIERTAVAVEKVSISPDCIVCEQVTKMLIKRLKEKRTREMIIQELDQVCDRFMPKAQQPECESLVNQYTEEMIDLLLAETDPKVICKRLGVCTLTSDSDPGVETTKSSTPSSPSRDVEGMFCGSCLLAREWISLQISGNQSEEALESALDQVCDRVVRRNREDCKEFVNQKLDIILRLLQTESDGKTFCTKLDLCGQPRVTTGPLPRVTTGPLPTVISSPLPGVISGPLADGLEREVETEAVTLFPQCFICKQVMHWLNTELRDNRTEAAISSALERVCPIFGHRIKNCPEQIEEYTQRLIMVLQTATSADIGCQLLGECTTVNTNTNSLESRTGPESRTEPESRTGPEVKSGEACFECESIAHFIQEQLYDFKKEKEIDDWITHSLCDKVNNVLAKETCDSFIQEYGPSILNLIALKAFDPKVLCQQTLKLCPSVSHPVIVPEFELTHPRGGACDLCIDTVARLDAYLASEETDKQIAEIAAQVCDEFDGHKKDQCVTIVTVYGPYFMQMIGRLSDPRKVCKSVDICQIAGQVHLLGGHKCTFGPTYWCHTTASASACRATDYCARSVWKPIDN